MNPEFCSEEEAKFWFIKSKKGNYKQADD